MEVKAKCVGQHPEKRWRLLIFQSGRKWYWHVRAANGEVIAEHGQAYNNLEDMVRILAHLFAGWMPEKTKATAKVRKK